MRTLLACLSALTCAAVAHADEPPRNPDLATQRMMLDVASGAWSLDHFVDRDAGVVVVDHTESPADEPAPQVEKRFCGRALTQTIRAWQRRSAEIRRSHDEGFLSCRNRPGPPTCTFGRSMEWDQAIHFIFRTDPDRGLLLTAITIDDEVLVDPRAVDREHRAQTRLIARLSSGTCPAP